MAEKKRVFGGMEAAFDMLYLAFCLFLVVYLIAAPQNPQRQFALWMALALGGGDAFHLIPRIATTLKRGDASRFRVALGVGKFATSVTMTAFYVLLWHLGASIIPGVHALWTDILYALAIIRVALLLPSENGWLLEKPPVKWGIIRNAPFALMGVQVAVLFACGGYASMAIAIALSFLFYIPVILFANEHPKVGMLMMPKTVMYVWILAMCAWTIH